MAISWCCFSACKFVSNKPENEKLCVILSGAAVSSAVEESSAYQLNATEKILRRASLAQDDTCGVRI